MKRRRNLKVQKGAGLKYVNLSALSKQLIETSHHSKNIAKSKKKIYILSKI